MNIVEFYKKLSRILEMCREKTISFSDAHFRLNELLKEAEKSNLDVNISPSILDLDNLTNYDDENSYEEYESSYNEDDSSYNEDEDSSY